MRGVVQAAAIALLFPVALCEAETAAMGWPEVIARVTQERQQAEICVGMIKSSKNTDALADAKATYEAAKPRVDGLIAGLTAALVEGGKPEALPTVRDDLEISGNDLKEIPAAQSRLVKRPPIKRAAGRKRSPRPRSKQPSSPSSIGSARSGRG